MLLEAKFIDKSLIILRISDEISGLMYEPFFTVCWAPAVLLTKIKAANTSPHTRLKVMLQNLSWTAKKKWLFFNVRSFLHPFHMTGARYCVRVTVGVTQPHPPLEIHHVLLPWLAGRTHVVQSAEVVSTLLDVCLTCQEMSRVCTVGRRAPPQNISGGVPPPRQRLSHVSLFWRCTKQEDYTVYFCFSGGHL